MRLARLRKYCGIYSQQKNGLRIDERSRISLFMRVRHVDQFAIHFHLTIPQKTASKYRVMRHASVTFDPAAPACDMPASLLTQRPRHATCQRHFRPSGRGKRLASSLLIQRRRQLSCQLTFDPAEASTEVPAPLLILRRRQLSCQRHF